MKPKNLIKFTRIIFRHYLLKLHFMLKAKILIQSTKKLFSAYNYNET